MPNQSFHKYNNSSEKRVERDPEPLRLDLGLEAGPMQGVPTTHQAGGAHCWLNPLSNRITILINIWNKNSKILIFRIKFSKRIKPSFWKPLMPLRFNFNFRMIFTPLFMLLHYEPVPRSQFLHRKSFWFMRGHYVISRPRSSPSVSTFFLFQNFSISLSDFLIIFFLSLTFPVSLSDFTIVPLSKNRKS